MGKPQILRDAAYERPDAYRCSSEAAEEVKHQHDDGTIFYRAGQIGHYWRFCDGAADKYYSSRYHTNVCDGSHRSCCQFFGVDVAEPLASEAA